MSCYNRLDNLKPKGAIKVEDPGTGSEASAIGTIMSDTLIALQNTLKNTNLNNDTNPNLKRPHFKGGNICFAEFDSYMKSFNIWTRKVTDKVKLLQLLRDTLSGSALKQIEELDICDDNYQKALNRLKKRKNLEAR